MGNTYRDLIGKQADLARAARISDGYLTHLLNGIRKPSADVALRINQASGIPLEIILRGAYGQKVPRPKHKGRLRPMAVGAGAESEPEQAHKDSAPTRPRQTTSTRSTRTANG